MIEKFDYKTIKPKIFKVKIENTTDIKPDMTETNKLLKKILNKEDNDIEISATLEII